MAVIAQGPCNGGCIPQNPLLVIAAAAMRSDVPYSRTESHGSHFQPARLPGIPPSADGEAPPLSRGVELRHRTSLYTQGDDLRNRQHGQCSRSSELRRKSLPLSSSSSVSGPCGAGLLFAVVAVNVPCVEDAGTSIHPQDVHRTAPPPSHAHPAFRRSHVPCRSTCIATRSFCRGTPVSKLLCKRPGLALAPPAGNNVTAPRAGSVTNACVPHTATGLTLGSLRAVREKPGGRATEIPRAKLKPFEDRCTASSCFTGRREGPAGVGAASARPAVTLQAPGSLHLYPGNGRPRQNVVETG